MRQNDPSSTFTLASPIRSEHAHSWGMLHVALGLATATIAQGCLGSTISVRDLEIMPPAMMVAKKSGVPLNLILDTNKVPPNVSVVVANERRGAVLADVNLFVERDLKRTFENYFSWVEVVSPEIAKTKNGIDAEIRIDRVEIVVVGHGLGYAEVTWSLAMRDKGAPDYLFSYAGKSQSEPTMDPEFALRSGLESAISDFVKAYSEKNVQETVLKLGVPAA